MDAMKTYKIAVLDDYQNATLESADWSVLYQRADITVFQDHLADPEAVIERLMPFDVICVMRERSPLPRNIIERLPNLKLIASTGAGNASIDVAAAGDCGIEVVHTGYRSDPAIEFTWALILASARHIATESNSVRSGGWQETVGADLRGKTLGVLGLGRIGSEVARIGTAFGMNLIAWSQNMTPQAAEAVGATLVSKNQLFEQADFLTIHVVFSSRTRGLIGAAEMARMKPSARLINTSARADRRRTSFDQRVEEQANRRRCDRMYSMLSRFLQIIPSGRWTTSWQHRTSAMCRKVCTRRSMRIRSRTFRRGSTPVRERHARGGDGNRVEDS